MFRHCFFDHRIVKNNPTQGFLRTVGWLGFFPCRIKGVCMSTLVWVYKIYVVVNVKWVNSPCPAITYYSWPRFDVLFYDVYQGIGGFVFNDCNRKHFLSPALCPQTPRLHQPVCSCDIFFFKILSCFRQFQLQCPGHKWHCFHWFAEWDQKLLWLSYTSPLYSFHQSKGMAHKLVYPEIGYMQNLYWSQILIIEPRSFWNENISLSKRNYPDLSWNLFEIQNA